MIERVTLSNVEKRRIRATLPVWSGVLPHRPQLEAFSAEMGVTARDVYTTLLHLDTLHALREDVPLIWKGGTAIQSVISSQIQRVSFDLDFNSSTGNVEIIRESMQDANQRLEDSGCLQEIQGVLYGAIFEKAHDKAREMIEFWRILPTPFDQKVELKEGTFPTLKGDVRIQATFSKIQINYHHSRMPALRSSLEEVVFFPQIRFQPVIPVRAERSSIEDLVGDKILATTRYDGFGRERFKDLYDLVALRHLGTVDLAVVHEKLSRIRGADRVIEYVEGSMETLRILGEDLASAQGFRNMVCKGGKDFIDSWTEEIEDTIEWMMPLVK